MNAGWGASVCCRELQCDGDKGSGLGIDRLPASGGFW